MTVRCPTAADIPWDLRPLPAAPVDPDPLVDALIETMAYRELAQAAIHALSDLTTAVRRLHERNDSVRKERR